MKEVVTRTWCDRTEAHLGSGPVPGKTREPLPSAGKPHTIDLCDPCDLEVLEPVRALLRTAGVPVAAPTLTAAFAKPRNHKAPDEPCPECGKEFKTVGGKRRHREAKHGVVEAA